jgi:hypothetical protein
MVGLVGHCAVRNNVMGERSLTNEPPTPVTEYGTNTGERPGRVLREFARG